MDPASILGAVSAASSALVTVCGASQKLYAFVKQAKTVDQSVTDLVQEVDALNIMLETVEMGLKSDFVNLADGRASAEDNRSLWEPVNGFLVNCQATVKRLETAFEDVRAEGGNFPTKAVRQLRLNIKDDELSSIRTQIRTYTNALHLSLQTVNLRATSIMPGAVAEVLNPKIDKLQSFMELVYGSESDLRSKSLGIEPEYLTKLQSSAEKVLSSAVTVSARSIASDSVLGDGMDEEKMNETLQWIQQPRDLEPPEGPPVPAVPAPVSDTGTSEYTASTVGDEESDSDSDFEYDLVEAYFARGNKAFEKRDFEEAKAILQEGFALAQRLSLNKKESMVQLADVRLKIAECIYHSSTPQEAEEPLFVISTEMLHKNVTDEGAIRRCKASHLLASLLYRQKRLGHALSYCKKAHTGRRRVLGRTHLATYESLGLLSQIYEAAGQEQKAKSCWSMIPADVASKLVRFKEEDMLLSPLASLQLADTQKPSTSDISNTSTSGDAHQDLRVSQSHTSPAQEPGQVMMPSPTDLETNRLSATWLVPQAEVSPSLDSQQRTQLDPAPTATTREQDRKSTDPDPTVSSTTERRTSFGRRLVDGLSFKTKPKDKKKSSPPPKEPVQLAAVDKTEQEKDYGGRRCSTRDSFAPSPSTVRKGSRDNKGARRPPQSFVDWYNEQDGGGDGPINFPGLSPY